MKKLEKAKEDARANVVRFSSEKKFEVTHMYGGMFVMDLERKICTCERWELMGIPCFHATACM